MRMEASQAILVVEDEPNFGRILETHLRRSGFDVVLATDAVTALQHLLRRRFSLVLLDLRLPDANSLEILPRLRVILPDTPFILMTAYEEENLKIRGARAGAVDVLYKPFDLESLVDTVRFHITEAAHRVETAGIPMFAVVPGQAVVLQVQTQARSDEYSARITGALSDRLAVETETSSGSSIGDPITVRLTGPDGIYRFRTSVLEAKKAGSVLVLSKPGVIRREQRRRYPRVALPVFMEITPIRKAQKPFAGDGESIEALGRDISQGGIAFLASCRIAVGIEIVMAWTLPEPHGAFQTSGIVLRSERGNGGEGLDFYRMAARFTRLPTETRARLSAFIENALQN